jgi:hypothetical protein
LCIDIGMPSILFILFEYPAARCGDGHENQLNLKCASFI